MSSSAQVNSFSSRPYFAISTANRYLPARPHLAHWIRSTRACHQVAKDDRAVAGHAHETEPVSDGEEAMGCGEDLGRGRSRIVSL